MLEAFIRTCIAAAAWKAGEDNWRQATAAEIYEFLMDLLAFNRYCEELCSEKSSGSA